MNAQQREVLMLAIKTIDSMGADGDNDAGLQRCARRMIAEVLGLPLDQYCLVMEPTPQHPLYYQSYED